MVSEPKGDQPRQYTRLYAEYMGYDGYTHGNEEDDYLKEKAESVALWWYFGHGHTDIRGNKPVRGDGEVMVVLVGHDLPAGTHSEFQYHWAGFYIFNAKKQLVGVGRHVSRASTFRPLGHETRGKGGDL